MKPNNIKLIVALYLPAIFCGCALNTEAPSTDILKDEIIKTEREFNAAVKTKGLAEAFYYYADENAVIKRQNDTLIKGKESIKRYYQNPRYENAELTWFPDFVDVSANGNLGYTYGKYTWKMKDPQGKITEYKGVFHTVWKRQDNGVWKYVWD